MKLWSLMCLWSFILVQHCWPDVYVIDTLQLSLRNPHSSFGFRVKLSTWVLIRDQMPFAKPWNSNTDSESVSRAASPTSCTQEFRSFSWFGWKSRVWQLAPSRGSPAPVHGSEPLDRADRTPSRTACSSEKTKIKSKLYAGLMWGRHTLAPADAVQMWIMDCGSTGDYNMWQSTCE